MTKTKSIINELVPMEGAKLHSLRQELSDYERELEKELAIVADLEARLATHKENVGVIEEDIFLTKRDIEDEESGN